MTPEQAKLVADSFSQLERRLPELGAAVYERLFYIAPETQRDVQRRHSGSA